MRIAYFVHDLNDATVIRRVDMFEHAKMDVVVAGFRRRESAPRHVAGSPAVDLGQTADGRLGQRTMSVLRHWLFTGRLRRSARNADVLVARNLEALVLAGRVRRRGQRLVYECLDIHRLLLGQGWASRAVRMLERWAMRRLDLVIVSAPSFLEEYYIPARDYRGSALLVENKVPAYDVPAQPPARREGRRPWIIGWFGMLRCRKTLEMLAEIARVSGGAVEIVIAGIPSPAEFADFAGQVGRMPGLTYLGPYSRADLPRLFGRIHFIWAIDYFEEGLNSAWLLPNRLYEGIAHGAIPIALASVATGKWLQRRGVGVLVDNPLLELPDFLSRLDEEEYAWLGAQLDAIPAGDVLLLPQECRSIVERIAGVAA